METTSPPRIGFTIDPEGGGWMVIGILIYLIRQGKAEDYNHPPEFWKLVDKLTPIITAMAPKIKEGIISKKSIELEEAEYWGLMVAMNYASELLMTDEGETWFARDFFPNYKGKGPENNTADEMAKGYLRFAQHFFSQDPEDPYFLRIKQDIKILIDKVFGEV